MLDVRLPDGDGVAVCREIRSRMPEVACLMLTSFGDDEALFEAIMAGASGYVLKQIRGTDLVDAVTHGGLRRVAARPGARRAAAWTGCGRQPPSDERLARLTGQERKILVLIAEGLDQPADRRARSSWPRRR